MMDWEWCVKRARWAPYFFEGSVLSARPSLALYRARVSSEQAARRNSPVSSKEREVT